MILNKFHSHRLLARVAMPLALCLGLLLPAAAQAQRKFDRGGGTNGVQIKSSEKFLAIFREPIAAATQSTVRVRCDGKDTALGTIVTADGFILTKYSDLSGKITVKLRSGKILPAELVGAHEGHDLAMLKVAAKKLTPVTWGTSKQVGVGDFVASVGMGSDPAAVGVISVATRNLPKFKGPALKAGSGYLGIGLEDAETGGALINRVEPKSAAEKAGLRAKDVIVAVEDKEILSAEALILAVQHYKPGETITLKLKRGNKEKELTATLGKRPPNSTRSDFQNNMGSELSKRRTGFLTVLQHDSVIKPADCGGPLVDLDGNVVGVNIARAGRVMSYATPAEVVQRLLPDLMSGKLAPLKNEK